MNKVNSDITGYDQTTLIKEEVLVRKGENLYQ